MAVAGRLPVCLSRSANQVSGAARIEVTEKLLAHTSGTMAGIVGLYQRHSYAEEMREAITEWEGKLARLLGTEATQPAD